MLTINDPSSVRGNWNYFDKRLGRGFVGTREHVIAQVQAAYLQNRFDFHEQEIPALVDDFMCRQGLAGECSERMSGLGDLIHYAALPIAQAIDRVAGTNLVGCTGCAARRAHLNQAVPFNK